MSGGAKPDEWIVRMAGTWNVLKIGARPRKQVVQTLYLFKGEGEALSETPKTAGEPPALHLFDGVVEGRSA